MRRLVHREPLRRRDLVGADHAANIVVENLRRGAGKRSQAEIGEMTEILGEAQAEGRGALPHLQRREGMHVDPGNRVPDRADDARVVVARERGMDPALETDLGRPSLPCLLRAADDLVERDEVRRAARRFAASLPLENAQNPQRK